MQERSQQLNFHATTRRLELVYWLSHFSIWLWLCHPQSIDWMRQDSQQNSTQLDSHFASSKHSIQWLFLWQITSLSSLKVWLSWPEMYAFLKESTCQSRSHIHFWHTICERICVDTVYSSKHTHEELSLSRIDTHPKATQIKNIARLETKKRRRKKYTLDHNLTETINRFEYQRRDYRIDWVFLKERGLFHTISLERRNRTLSSNKIKKKVIHE